jgi:hypothetical protein
MRKGLRAIKEVGRFVGEVLVQMGCAIALIIGMMFLLECLVAGFKVVVWGGGR